MMRELFLDTSYAIALAAPGDTYHQRAVVLSREIQQRQVKVITTRAVMIEIGNALSRRRFRAAAIALLTALEMDTRVEIESLSDELFHQGVQLFQQRNDKDWSLVDCISFVLMQARGIVEALTADDHFRQAGFRALLLES